MTTQINEVIQHLRSALLLREGADLTDGQLLECFVSRREPAALEALVRRHGPMVWGVCRRSLRNHHDAEDAFQATFLVLVRKAASVMPREMVGNWLCGVAYQTARKARATAAKQRARERQVVDMPEPAVKEQELSCDLQAVLDQELSRLPDKYRVAIVLCDLAGKTRKEAARQLGLPEGTLAGRLTRGRAMLAKRLARHGLAVSGATLAAAVLSQKAASACMPTSVVSSTIKAVTAVAAGQAAAGLISARVVVLTHEVVKAMFLNKLKTVMTVLFVVLGMVAFGGGLYMHQAEAQQGPADKSPAVGEKGEKEGKAPADGKAVGGLRIRLQLPAAEKGKMLPPHCVVVLENVGETDLNVQLGYSLANGKSHHPAALRLYALSKGNKTRTLTYMQVGVAGRLDPLVVPLPAGSTYTLRCQWAKFADSETGEPIDLTAKDYRIAAELIGQPVTKVNPDLQGFALMPFWQGTARSNEVQFPLAKKQSDK